MKLLKFYTTHCSQCKVQDKLLKDFTDAEVVPVDCDEKEDMVDLYNIRNLPTLILENGNKEVARFTGITQVSVIKEAIKNANI
jgi:thioredoxin-like negative regulator of GroEL